MEISWFATVVAMKKILLTLGLLISVSVKPLFAGVDKEIDVREVQTLLAELCFDPGPIDGLWGNKTEKAIKNLYATVKGSYDGQFDLIDLGFLREYPIWHGKTKCGSNRSINSEENNSENDDKPNAGSKDTKVIQLGLVALGHMSGEIDGVLGPTSRDAVNNYLTVKKSKLRLDDLQEIKELLIKDISKANPDELMINVQRNLRWKASERKELRENILPSQTISIAELKKSGRHGVYIVIDQEINVDSDQNFGSLDKLFILNSSINSQSNYRNEFEVKFSGNAFLSVINSVSKSDRDKEAFLFTYSGNASALHINYKHDMGDPWQVAKSHRGKLFFFDSTCNVTLLKRSKTKLDCLRADKVMIEPILPKGKFKVSLPSYKTVKAWQSDNSLPWKVVLRDSYVSHIDFGIGPGVDLTVIDTEKFQGGIAMCCSGSGIIKGLRANRIYENKSVSVSSDQGRAKLTLINSSSGGFWPTAWGKYSFKISDSDLIDPTLGDDASMEISDSSLDMIRAKERARVKIIDSVLTDADSERSKIVATGSAMIRIITLEGLQQHHMYTQGAGRIVIE